jgi:hypothetical protein
MSQEDQNVTLFNTRYRAGTQAYEKQDYAEAIKNFQLAYAQKPEALLLYNIAQCHRKLNHDGEAITYFQSFLNSSEPIEPDLRAKAERFLGELKNHQAPPPPKVIYVEHARQPRPAWRIGLGAGLLAVSTLPLGLGGRALYLDGSCADTPMGTQVRCNTVVDTQPLGIGLVIGGAALAVLGAVTIAIPGRAQQVQRSGAPEDPGAPTVIKPMASRWPLLVPAAPASPAATATE